MNKLTDLEALEVSLVPKGANKKKFLIMKSEEGESMEEILKAVLETQLENEAEVDKVLKALSEKGQNAIKGALRLLNAYKDELPKDVMKTLASLAGYGYAAPEKAGKKDEEEYEYGEKKKKKEATKKELSLEDVPAEVRPALEALWKQNEELSKASTEAVKKSEEMEKILKEERDRQLTKEYIAKAREYRSLPVEPNEFGLVLKHLAETAPKEYEKLEGVLKAADEALVQSDIYREIGSGGSNPSSASAKIEALAKSLVEKDAKMTKEQAMVRVLESNPDLYVDHLRETKGGAN